MENSSIDFSRVYPLSTPWVYWYHDFSDDFAEDTFKCVCSFNTIEGFWRLFNNLFPLTSGMYFLMREGISPSWEEKQNSHLWWFRREIASEKDALQMWIGLGLQAVGETLTKDFTLSPHINGISISPKDNAFVFKIWMNGNYQNSGFNPIVLENNEFMTLEDDARFLFNNQKRGHFQSKRGKRNKNHNK